MMITQYSNPTIVYKNATKYLGKDVIIKLSTNRNKKYMVFNPIKKTYIHFGQMGYEDFTKHHDKARQSNYLNRSASLKGDWKNDPYSANNLSRNILWS
jgi:hypothetical protein